MVTVFSMGANQSVSGTDNGNAIINVHLAMRPTNAPGMGPVSMTGQPYANDGRELGGLARAGEVLGPSRYFANGNCYLENDPSDLAMELYANPRVCN